MRTSLLSTALVLLAARHVHAQQTTTLHPLADAQVSEFDPDAELGGEPYLRVRDASDGTYRSFLQFPPKPAGTIVSATLRLFCADGSPDAGWLFAVADSRWSESDVTWDTQPGPRVAGIAPLRSVADGTWVELDVTEAVRYGARTYALGLGSSNSAFFSSREGARPPELVVTVDPDGGGGPVADFTGAPLTGQEPLQTVFTDLSTGNVTSWRWDFGDGASSTQRNPVHTYGSAGTYSVRLTVGGPEGSASLAKQGYVRVLAADVQGIWTSSRELAALPESGRAWDSLLSDAQRSTSSPDISNQDDDTDVYVLAKALVYARTGEESYRTQVIQACRNAIGTENGGRTLALGRNLIGYVLAADLVGLPSSDDTVFRAWLRDCLSKELDGRTLRSTHEDRPNNWGTHAGASRAAVAMYLGDTAELEATARVFRGYLGDRSAYAGFEYGALDWQADPSRPVGINPRGARIDGQNVDGVLPDDQRRAGDFTWPPPKENYVWEGLQGALAQAVILDRAGYDVWEWSDQALLRAVTWLHSVCDYPASGDDTWQPHVINHYYGTSFPAPIPSQHGKNVGWTDYTHSD